MPVTSENALSSLACTRLASSSRCSSDHSGLACTVQRSTLLRCGLDDSRASQAMRWCVLRAAFHCGPRVVRPGRTACGKASVSVQQGATYTLARSSISGMSRSDDTSSARAWGAGSASSTASKPASTRPSPLSFSMFTCQPERTRRSRSSDTTSASVCSTPASCSGAAQASASDCMPGQATQCASCGGRPTAVTRPSASSTRTALALQGRHTPGTVARASAKRLSRTVKYWAPVSKPPCGVLRVVVRPPTWLYFSSTVTLCPACTSVRAQTMPASPAPTTAKWRWAGAVAGALLRGWRVFLAEAAGAAGALLAAGVLAALVPAGFALRWLRGRVAAAGGRAEGMAGLSKGVRNGEIRCWHSTRWRPCVQRNGRVYCLL